MTSLQQQQRQFHSGTTATPPVKSVWKKVHDPTSFKTLQPSSQTLVNGTTDDGHDRDSVSSRDVTQGEGLSQGQSTPASSMTDEVRIGSPGPELPLPSIPDDNQTLSPSSAYNQKTSVKDKGHSLQQQTSKESQQKSSKGYLKSHPKDSPNPQKPFSKEKHQHPPVNGTSVDNQDKDSLSLKATTHGDGSLQSHSTLAGSLTDEAQATSLAAPPAPAYRPAPLPTVNPWKARQEEMERKRWKESQETPLTPLQMDRVVPKPPIANSANKPNGLVKSDGTNFYPHSSNGDVVKGPVRRPNKLNSAPPALEDPEAWPSPEVAAIVEKEDRVKTTPTVSSKEGSSTPAMEGSMEGSKEMSTEGPKEGEHREHREPRETKKKKWEKIEVNFQYDSPQARRGRGGKFNNRGGRGGGKDSYQRGKEGAHDRPERDEKLRDTPRSDNEDVNLAGAKGDLPAMERRAQSMSFESGRQTHDVQHPPQWVMPAPYAQEPLPMNPPDGLRRETSPARFNRHARQMHGPRDPSAQRSQSRGSSRGKNSSSPDGSKRDVDHHISATTSPNGQVQFTDLPSQWEDPDQHTQNSQFNQQSNQTRRGAGRGSYRPRNGYSPINYPQQPPTQQLPFQGFYPSIYPPPMQAGFPMNTRAHSVPYYQPNAMSRYPQPGFPPQWMPDFSRLGVQPVPVDEEMKQRIVRQVCVPPLPFVTIANILREYYFSSDNLAKDVYLRKKMDSQGFVPLQALVQFNRLQVITGDVPTVLNALLTSSELDVLYNSERGPLVRARHDPLKWVFPINERDESAKHQGPAPHFFQAHHDTIRQMQEAQQYPPPQPYFFDGQYGFPPAAPFRPQEQDNVPPIDADMGSPSPVSPHFDPQNRKLSGEASVFVPNGVGYGPPNGDSNAFDLQNVRNAIPTVDEESEQMLVDPLDEESLANLVLIVTEPKEKPIIPALPMNGVSHKNDRDEETLGSPQPVTWRFSDVTAATQASASTSVKSGLSSLTAQEEVPPRNRTGGTALTEKNLKKQATQSGITEYSYPDFRSKAMQSRQASLKFNRDSTQMIYLYQFWADFLCDYWDPSMYREFVECAVEDANHSHRSGLLKLFSMYERALGAKFRVFPWNDFVRLAGEDYRNGYFSGVERIWRIRGDLANRGRNVTIRDPDVSRLVDAEIHSASDLDRLRREVKSSNVVLVPYTTVLSLRLHRLTF